MRNPLGEIPLSLCRLKWETKTFLELMPESNRGKASAHVGNTVTFSKVKDQLSTQHGNVVGQGQLTEKHLKVNR